MSYRRRWTPEAIQTFQELQRAAQRHQQRGGGAADAQLKTSKQAGLFKQVAKGVRLLADDPRHPGLNTHQYESLSHPFDDHGKVFEAYAQNRTPGAYRIFWCYGPDRGEITILAITPHP